MLALFEGLAESSDVQALSGFLTDRASLRRAEGRLRDPASLDEAHSIFEGLKATPWLERVAALAGARAALPAL